MAKKKVKLTEDILRGIIRESVNEFIGFDGQGGVNEDETPWMDDHEADYHKNHARYGKHDDPFFLSNFEYDKALDADSPEEYDEIMRGRDNVLKTNGELAQNHHPQCTPFRSIDKDDLNSYNTSVYPRDKEFDPDDEYNSPSVSAKIDGRRFPNGKLTEGILRNIIRESLRGIYGDGINGSFSTTGGVYGNQWEQEIKIFLDGLRDGRALLDNGIVVVEWGHNESDPRFIYYREGEDRLTDDHFSQQHSRRLSWDEISEIHYLCKQIYGVKIDIPEGEYWEEIENEY